MFVEKLDFKVLLEKNHLTDDHVYENINHICEIIDRKEPSVRALVPEENRKARLLREAELLINKYPDRSKRPPLFGVPIGVKDIFITDGFETRCGSQLPPGLFTGREATSVKDLKTAGALILGKTVTTEFAYFEPGPTRNPYNPDHTPGGSSSGSAAAVACGYTPLALGTQTIGSVTRPASFCGIVGFKPSFGRIPTDGVIPFSPSADHVGFFVQNVDDVSVVAPLLCENWNAGSSSGDEPLKIGAVIGPYIEQSDSEVQRNYRSHIDRIRNKGHEVVEIDLFGDIAGINALHRKMVSADFALTHQEWFAEYSHLYRAASRELIQEGYPVTIRELIEARKNRSILRAKIESTMKDNAIDFFISTSTVSAAPRGMATGSPLMNLPWTFAGLPTLTLPSGFSDNGLPLGLQLAGGFYRDEKLINDAVRFSREMLEK